MPAGLALYSLTESVRSPFHAEPTQFWQAESSDHWVRDDSERERIAGYIEMNPVRAGFVDSADMYRWSSAGKSVETSLDAADTSVRATVASGQEIASVR